MAIDLNRLLEDIRNPDEDMAVLALRTLKRIQGASFSNEPKVSGLILAELDRLIETSSDDVRFFAQECADYVREYVSDTPAVSAPEPAPFNPATTSGKAIVAGLESRDKVLAFLKKGLADPQKASTVLNGFRPFVRSEDLPLLKKYLRHKAPQVRIYAAQAIAATGDERGILEALLPYLNDRSEDVRNLVMKAIRSIDHNRLMTVIESMLRAQQISIKIAAVYILAHLQGDEVTRLLGIAARDGEEEVRSRVVDALQGRRGKDVLVILKGLVNDMDIDVAEKALKIYEKLKVEEGILNSSAELGDVIMEKLREISLEDDESSDENEPAVPLEVPTGSSGRIPIGSPQKLQEYTVPKKTQRAARRATKPTEEMQKDEKASFKSLSELPEELQKETEELYDQLDTILEDMGRTIWKLEKSNRISDRRFAKLNYDIQRYEDMMAKRKEESGKEGFFARLSAGNRKMQEKQQLNMEFSLSELYRSLGEVAVELSLSEENRFAELEKFYGKVNSLLEEVHNLKSSGAY